MTTKIKPGPKPPAPESPTGPRPGRCKEADRLRSLWWESGWGDDQETALEELKGHIANCDGCQRIIQYDTARSAFADHPYYDDEKDY